MAITSTDVRWTAAGLKAIFDGYAVQDDTGGGTTTFYIVGINAAGAAALDLATDLTYADISGVTHGPDAVTVATSFSGSNFDITLTDISGGFTDSGSSGPTVALLLFGDNGGNDTGTARQLLAYDYKPHSLATDGVNDSIDFPSDYSWRLTV